MKPQIVKGFCPICNKFRAFEFLEFHQNVEPVYACGNTRPVFIIPKSLTHYGNCKGGHYTQFDREVKRSTFPKRSVTPTIKPFGRGVGAYALYAAWLDSFRRPEQEAHFKPGHKCSIVCPEYAWPELEAYYDGVWNP